MKNVNNQSLASVLGGNAMYNLILPSILPPSTSQPVSSPENRQQQQRQTVPATTQAQMKPTQNVERQELNPTQKDPPDINSSLSTEQAKSIKLRSKL